MIVVTVGTHEQPFDRLFNEVNRLISAGVITDIFCQTGYSTVEMLCDSAPMLDYAELDERLQNASMVISHGGPGSVLSALSHQRPLVLVPRQSRLGEHVDDHQVLFCRRLHDTHGCPVVEDISTLSAAVLDCRQSTNAHRGGSDALAALAALVEDSARHSRWHRIWQRR